MTTLDETAVEIADVLDEDAEKVCTYGLDNVMLTHQQASRLLVLARLGKRDQHSLVEIYDAIVDHRDSLSPHSREATEADDVLRALACVMTTAGVDVPHRFDDDSAN